MSGGGQRPASTVRIRFSKLGPVRFISHRDVARAWERALRRAELAVAYSEGFAPRPKLHFGLALSTGHESVAEYLDVDLAPPAPGRKAVDVSELPARLSPTLPVGIDVQAAAALHTGTDSLQQAVTSCSWRIQVTGGEAGSLAAAVDAVLAAGELPVTRQRKGSDVTDDLRPYIVDLTPVGPADARAELVAHLGTQPRGLRPSELLSALGAQFELVRACRTHQWMRGDDDALREPLPLTDPPDPPVWADPHPSSTPAPHARARAS